MLKCDILWFHNHFSDWHCFSYLVNSFVSCSILIGFRFSDSNSRGVLREALWGRDLPVSRFPRQVCDAQKNKTFYYMKAGLRMGNQGTQNLWAITPLSTEYTKKNFQKAFWESWLSFPFLGICYIPSKPASLCYLNSHLNSFLHF